MQTMHLLPSVEIPPNFELKTRPTQLLGSPSLVITLPGSTKLGKISCKILSLGGRMSPRYVLELFVQ